MKKEQVLARMKEDCLVAVVRAKNYEQGEKVVEAIIAGGINFIELTMTMDDGDPVGFIKLMAEKYKDNDKIVIGAGTVLDPETARACILAGANFARTTATRQSSFILAKTCSFFIFILLLFEFAYANHFHNYDLYT